MGVNPCDVIFDPASEWHWNAHGVPGFRDDCPICALVNKPTLIDRIEAAWGGMFADKLRTIERHFQRHADPFVADYNWLAIRAAIEERVREEDWKRNGPGPDLDDDDGCSVCDAALQCLFARTPADFARTLHALFDEMGVTPPDRREGGR